MRRAVPGPFYALLLGPTLVLAEYGATHVSPYHLIRPMVVATLVAGLLFYLLSAVTRRQHIAALVVAVTLLAVVGAAVLLAVVLLAIPVAGWWSLRRHGSWRAASTLTPVLNTLVSVWLVVAGATALLVSLPSDLPAPDQISMVPDQSIYLILLDAYPRADTLMEYFGFDNGPFIDALEDRGFTVASSSTSANPGTSQVVPAMLRMQSLDELLHGEEWAGSNEQYRLTWHALNSASVPRAYEAAGFETYAILTTAESLDWRGADVVSETGWLTRFEDHLLNRGLIVGLIPFSAMDRAELIDGFRHLDEAIGASRRFVFAHMMTPHNPYVFTADGGPAAACGEPCANHIGPPNAMLGDRLTGQLLWTNERVLEAVDRIIEVDPQATIIVFGDHGMRRDPTDPDEWHRPLFAARGAAFPDDIVVEDIFKTLFGQPMADGVVSHQ